jgi:glycosyltransferase involved in cell wall biosynthesis
MNATPLSVIIPMYNEAMCIAENVGRIGTYLSENGHPAHEFVLVDDGSTDRTAEICDELSHFSVGAVRLIRCRQNRGKGHAVKTGMLAARGEVRLYTDADLAVPVEYFGECIRLVQHGAGVAIASRHLKASAFAVPEGWLRRTLGGIYRRLTLAAFALPVSDITCGLKAFHASAATSIFSRSIVDRWGYDAEILFLAARMGVTIHEFPVTWFHSFDSAVRVGTDSFRTLVEMMQITLHYRKGRYRIP